MYPNIFPKVKIQQLLDDGLVRVQKHPDADLWIWNYTQAAQFSGSLKTDAVLRHLRGMITDASGTVVARGFPKFFNLGEQPDVDREYQDKSFYVDTKYDGSLGILYKANGQYAIATRGSFLSPQAIEGTKILHEYLVQNGTLVFDHYLYNDSTVLFEIIYPENRIVVDYGVTRKLQYIGAVDNRTGLDFETRDIRNLVLESPEQVINNRLGAGAEGFVLVYPDSHRVKVKYSEYCRLHRIVTGLNELAVWEALASGSLESLVESCPDEFFPWVKATAKKYQDQFDCYDRGVRNEFLTTYDQNCFTTKGSMARAVQNHPARSLFFALWDGKTDVYRRTIWNNLRPFGVTSGPFNARDEV